jgi:hypothetical protein
MTWNCARDEKSKHAYHIFFPLTTYLEKMLPLTDINETIETWLFDDEDYPACNRLVRRLAKRTSKRKLYRKCKEKHKTWERCKNRIMEELYYA